MMTLSDLMASLERRGVLLSVSGGDIVLDAPDGAISPEDLADLRQHKQAIMTWLRDRSSEVTAKQSTSPLRRPPDGVPPTQQADERPTPKPATTIPWPGAAADFALLLQPSDLPERFELHEAVVVVDRERFLRWLQRDIRRGPRVPRTMYGAIQSDLAELRRIVLARADSTDVVGDLFSVATERGERMAKLATGGNAV